MSSKRMPGAGKSGNWRSAERSFIVRRVSSEEREEGEVESLLLEASLEVEEWLLDSRVGSGLEAAGWELVDGGMSEVGVGREVDIMEREEGKKEGRGERRRDGGIVWERGARGRESGGISVVGWWMEGKEGKATGVWRE